MSNPDIILLGSFFAFMIIGAIAYCIYPDTDPTYGNFL